MRVIVSVLAVTLAVSPAWSQRLEMHQLTEDRLSVPVVGFVAVAGPGCGLRSQMWGDRVRDRATAAFATVSILEPGATPTAEERAAWMGAYAMAERMARLYLTTNRGFLCSAIRDPRVFEIGDMMAGPDPAPPTRPAPAPSRPRSRT